MVATTDGEKYGSYANKPFTIIVNGTAYEKPYETQSKPDADNYYQMWESLISAREIKLTTPDGKSLLLPINNAEKVIPSNKSNDFHCFTGYRVAEIKVQQANKPTNTIPLQPNELNVSWYNHSSWEIPVLQITSRTDDIFIQNIILNRGNCRITAPGERPSNPRLPARLKFGTEIKFYVASLCQILEADIMTNRGTITYTFQ